MAQSKTWITSRCHLAEGQPVDRRVTLQDQFQDEQDIQVGQPVLFCNPTVKFHGGAFTLIENSEAHLTCYFTTQTDFRGALITARNQFQTTELAINQADILCVPSRKIIRTELPDLVIRLLGPVQVDCPTGGGSCEETVDWEVSEVNGVDVNQSFDVVITNELGQTDSANLTGIGANSTTNGTSVLGPPGDNCYNPDCTTRGRVDSTDTVPEADEGNNTDSRTDQG